MRKTLMYLAVSAGAWVASVSLAHTPLKSSIPAAGAALAASPQEIVLEFPHAVRLTAVVLTDGAGATKPVGAISTEPAARFAVAVSSPLTAGDYEVAWRAVGADTHVISGTIEFSVKPPLAR
jgi:methionine-rich copper-binding protein CopC